MFLLVEPPGPEISVEADGIVGLVVAVSDGFVVGGEPRLLDPGQIGRIVEWNLARRIAAEPSPEAPVGFRVAVGFDRRLGDFRGVLHRAGGGAPDGDAEPEIRNGGNQRDAVHLGAQSVFQRIFIAERERERRTAR